MPLFAPHYFDNTATAEEDISDGLIEKVISTAGGIEKLKSLNDVEYVYVVRYPTGELDISLERYIFEGELSWGEYIVSEASKYSDKNGRIVQGFNGDKTWVTLNGTPVTDPKILRTADFQRKTNYYWFAMMFKLDDPGTNHRYIGTRKEDGTRYEVVELTFDEGVGDVSDIYILYINPSTYLVDKFLFTVLDFGIKEPYLMEVSYKAHEGLLLPVYRRFTNADWDGKALSTEWVEEFTINPVFSNGFKSKMFEAPFHALGN